MPSALGSRRFAVAASAVLAGGWLGAGTASAQQYPAKAVRVIVPWAAGGSTDSIGRILAAKLTEYTGQQFVIDNRAGAQGAIATDIVARAAPDGYTIVMGQSDNMALGPHLYSNVGYDTVKSFAPIVHALTDFFVFDGGFFVGRLLGCHVFAFK